MRPPHWNIDDWQKMFDSIYRIKNKVMSVEQICARLVEETAGLVFPVIQQHPNVVKREMPDVFAWLLALCSKVDINLHKVTWEKYKKGCPSCGKLMDCTEAVIIDGGYGLRTDKKISKYEIPSPVVDFIQHQEPTSLDEWQDLFDMIYGKTNRVMLPHYLLIRLVEDVGFLSKMARKKESKERIAWKLASIFAWLLSLCNRYSYSAERGKYLLSEITWMKYSNSCYKCLNSPCICTKLQNVYISCSRKMTGEFKTVKSALEENNLRAIWFDRLEDNQFPFRVPTTNIENSDAAIVILGESFDPAIYAEFTTISKFVEERFIFIYAKVSTSSEELANDFIEQIEQLFNIGYYRNEEDLLIKVRRDLHTIKKYQFN
ncbi:MAG: hypothetical protein ACFFD4_35890 [Candidatus Odinarchaeota archaeon]